MSMSVRDDASGLEYAGALGLGGLFPTARNLAPAGVPADARRDPPLPPPGQVGARGGCAATVSTTPRRTSRCGSSWPTAGSRRTSRSTSWSRWSPRSGRATRPWRSTTPPATCSSSSTTTGCSASSGRRSGAPSPAARASTSPGVAATLQEVRIGTKVTSVTETPSGVEVTDGNGVVSTYDAVVVATHPAQALAMLAEPTSAQRDVLGRDALLAQHRPPAHRHLAPAAGPPSARASWNFLRPRRRRRQVTVTYDLTRLQRLDTETHYLVTLGGEHLVDPATVIDRMEYEHPLYTPPRWPRSAGCPRSTPPDRVRRRLPRVGFPRGRRAFRAGGRRAAGPGAGSRSLRARW